MTNINLQRNEDAEDGREVDGLFCEEVLREWLQTLEQLIDQRDRAQPATPVPAARPDHRDAHLTLVQNSGRGT